MTQAAPQAGISTVASKRRVLVIVTVIAAIAAIVLWKTGYFPHGVPSDRSQAIAAQIGGGAICIATSYEMTNRLDGSKARLYDCRGTNEGEICVTESGGIVNDATAAAKLLFANTVGANTPSCAQ